MPQYESKISMRSLSNLCEEYKKNNYISPDDYKTYDVKRGLRNADGSGVVAGLTRICNVHGYYFSDGARIPDKGKLTYRGIDVAEIIEGCTAAGHFGFEEVAWLLLFGELPTREKLDGFREILGECRELPEYFAEDMIIKAPSPNVMNNLPRSVLALESYDMNPHNTSITNIIPQSIELIARIPTIMVYAYQVKRRQYDHKSMYFHPIDKSHSTSEFILSSMRADRKFTAEEARLLDTCLILHAEHGGGNNSTFTNHVVTSSGTDTYSAMAASLGSMKGPRHGGANIKVVHMFDDMKENVRDWGSDSQIRAYLSDVLDKKAFDHSGLIYGMGHAVYSVSDPRAEILMDYARRLSAEKGRGDEYELYRNTARIASDLIAERRKIYKGVSHNVDFFSGFVYRMLGLPEELFTPIFAVSRIAGWSAHRMEEIINTGKIIRPAYRAVKDRVPYVKLDERA